MEKIGIICEYNPFHNGHIYHINKIKEKYPDSLIILVLNGYFLERGEISVLSKYDKTNIALKYGVDLVMELPFVYGVQSADTFAYRSVQILNELKVNRIIFGSESNDIDMLNKLADLSLDKNHDEKIKELLDTGINYPTALAKALNTEFVFNSNDLLGISYCKAIKQINNNIIAETIKRTNNYLDTTSNDDVISASNIREKLYQGISIEKYVPKCTYNSIINISSSMKFNLLKYEILHNERLDEYLDVDEGIDNRLKEGILKVNSYDELVDFLKSKRYTYNKINRMLIHILIGLKKIDAKYEMDSLKVLGMNNNGQKYLNEIKKDITIPFNNKDSKLYDYEIKASIIYGMLAGSNEFYEKEKTNKPIIY